jgi:hypothetical protein
MRHRYVEHMIPALNLTQEVLIPNLFEGKVNLVRTHAFDVSWEYEHT